MSYFCLSRECNPSGFVNLSLFFLFLFVYFSVNAQKAEIVIEKQIHMYLKLYRHKNKNFSWFLGFRVEPYTQKWKLESHGNSSKTLKILKYENGISRTLEIFFKCHRSQNNWATLLIVCHIFVFQENVTPLDLLT